MTSERVERGTSPDLANVLADGGEGSLPPALRLQILTTEHWSLLSTRALSWNEAFSRATMFLSVLSGAVVALALVAQATAFGEGFMTFALLILPVVLFVGVATFMRLVAMGRRLRGSPTGSRGSDHSALAATPSRRCASSSRYVHLSWGAPLDGRATFDHAPIVWRRRFEGDPAGMRLQPRSSESSRTVGQ